MSIVRLVRICLVLGVAATTIALYLAYSLYQTRSATFSAAESAAYQAAADAAQGIDSELNGIESIVNSLARQLSATKLSEEALNAKLRKLMRDNPPFQSVGLAYAPYSFDPKRRLYAPALMRDGESFESFHLETVGDYTLGDFQLYNTTVQDGPTWVEPVWQDAEQEVTATFSTPLYRTDDEGQRQVAGVTYASISVESIAASVAALDVGRTGWGFVASKEGYVIVHPDNRIVRQRMNILEFAEAKKDEALRAAAERATRGESGMIEAVNHITGQSSWSVYRPIAVTGWSIVVVSIKDEIQIEPQFVRRRVIWASVSAILGLTCLAIWFGAGWYERRPKRAILWGIVVFSSALLGSGMAAIRHVTHSQVAEDRRESVEIVDETGLQSFLKSQAMAPELCTAGCT